MTDAECTIDDIGGFLADQTARQILIEASQQPISVESLSQATEVSKPTVYRRINDMRQCDLLRERTQLDPKAGHHRTVFSTNLQRIVVELEAQGFEFELDHREPMEDRFTRLIEEI